MGYTVPTSEPAVLVAGDTWSWTKTLANYPTSEGWTLSYVLVSPRSTLTFDATISGSVYSVTRTAAQTGNVLDGRYHWTSTVSLAGEVHTLEEGDVEVRANPATVTAADSRTHARRMLEAIEAVLENRIPADIQNYAIAGRAITAIPVLELRRLRAAYAAEVDAEERPGRYGRPVEYAFRSAR